VTDTPQLSDRFASGRQNSAFFCQSPLDTVVERQGRSRRGGFAGDRGESNPLGAWRTRGTATRGPLTGGSFGTADQRVLRQGDHDARPRRLRVRYERAGRSFYSATAAGGAAVSAIGHTDDSGTQH
jgi:hypothetical protein